MRNLLQLLAITVAAMPRPVAAQAPESAGDAPSDEAIAPGEDPIWARLAPRPGGLTADKAGQSAAAAAPSVQKAEAEILASRARTSTTLSRYVPRIALSATYTRTNPTDIDFSASGYLVGAANEGGLVVGTCPDGVTTNCVLDSAGTPVAGVGFGSFEIPQNNYKLELSVSIPLSDYVLAMPLARTASKADEVSLELNREAELRRVRVNAKIAFYDWARAQAQVAVAEQSLTGAEARLSDARIGLDAGIVTSADVLSLESLVASSQVALEQARSFSRLAEKNLQLLAQVSGQQTIGEDLAAPLPSAAELGTVDELVTRGQSNRAELRSLLKAIAASRDAVKLAAVGKYPKLDGIAGVTHANPNPAYFPPGPDWNTTWFAGASISWHLDGYFSAKAQSEELDANTQGLLAQRTALERSIEIEVLAAWEEWQRASAAARISATELKATLATYEQRVLLFRAGAGTSTDVVEAELQRHNATLRSVNARIEQRIALAKLRHAAAVDASAGEGRR